MIDLFKPEKRGRARPLPRALCGALVAALCAGAAMAQESGVAVQISPSTDGFSQPRVDLRVWGTAVDPASDYVRGCAGFTLSQADGVRFDVTERLEALAFTAAGESVASMVVGTPDGLFQCALADENGMAVAQLANARPGPYRVWLGGPAAGARVEGRLIAAMRPVSALELFGLDLAALGAPRAGRFDFHVSPETRQMQLARGAELFAEEPMDPLSRDYCAGFGRFDAPDAVLSVDDANLPDRLTFFARSERDLTMAVVAPDGRVLCNDDADDLNPAVEIDSPRAGDYYVFVGGYSQGGSGRFDLFAGVDRVGARTMPIDPAAPPRLGSAALDMNLAGLGYQSLATGALNAREPLAMLPVGDTCPGWGDPSAPDFVLTLDQPQSMISVFARSGADLVLVVQTPDGRWLCNDDAFELNPAVAIENAPAGDYRVHVGAYNPGTEGEFTLFAALGVPNWDDSRAPSSAAPAMLDVTAPPAVGRIAFGPDTRLDPRIIFDIQPSQTEAFGMGEGCAGFITPAQPDLVVEAQPGLPQLMLYMVSEADGTLVVVGPDGQLHCNDDFEGLNPGVMIPNPQAGDYAVFAGTYSGTGGLATLGITIASPHWVMDREP